MSPPIAPSTRDRVLKVVPRAVRMRLFAWHPGRDRRWHRFPGIQYGAQESAFLTFDDGPGRDATPQVLDALAAAEVKATFFLLGSEVQLEPDLAREIVSGGHEIALHGFHHRRQDKLGESEARENIESGLHVLEQVTGQRPRWYRPPFGRMSAASASICQDLNLEVAYWSSWGLDWEDLGDEAIVAVVCSSLSNGSIVLLHDAASYGRRASARPTAKAIGPIVTYGRELGLTWRTLTDARDG